MEPIAPPTCPECGKSRKDCHGKHRRHPYERLTSPLYCTGAVHQGILRLKHCDDPLAVSFFAEQMAVVVRRDLPDERIDLVTYIPMTAADQRARGYNQGELLARDLAKRLSLPLVPTLRKCYQTQPQKHLNAVERTGNVLGVFDVCQGAAIADKTVLLVDDVITTGATVDECTKMLKLYGAKRVFCVTASVRRPDGDEKPPAENDLR